MIDLYITEREKTEVILIQYIFRMNFFFLWSAAPRIEILAPPLLMSNDMP